MSPTISRSTYLSTGRRHEKPILWCAPSSAFSGKLRGYIAKSGLQVEERFAREKRFHEEIVPLIGYFVIPVIELEDGMLLQDTTDAIMYFEKQATSSIRNSLIPATPLRKATAHLINFLGTDGFHKPGMHYRWSYESKQELFLDTAFADWVAPKQGITRKEQTAYFTSDYLPALGIYKETLGVIEQAWEECLDILNDHFNVHPYFLGATPTIADCGFMTMVWAHLARDPVPAWLMRTRAPMVSRWAERMVREPWFDGGFLDADPAAKEDDLPDTLMPFIQYLFARVAPETIASIVAYQEGIEKSDLKSGDLVDSRAAKPNAHPTCGEIEFELLGTKVKRYAFVDTACQFQTFLGALEEIPDKDGAKFAAMVSKYRGDKLLSLKITRPVEYFKYRYRLV